MTVTTLKRDLMLAVENFNMSTQYANSRHIHLFITGFDQILKCTCLKEYIMEITLLLESFRKKELKLKWTMVHP